jgi:hypothetical protein
MDKQQASGFWQQGTFKLYPLVDSFIGLFSVNFFLADRLGITYTFFMCVCGIAPNLISSCLLSNVPWYNQIRTSTYLSKIVPALVENLKDVVLLIKCHFTP